MTSTVSYCTADDIKTAMSQTSSTDDTKLTALALVASRMIDNYCRRTEFGFVASDTAEALQLTTDEKSYVYIPECVEITLVEYKESVTDSTYQSLDSDAWIPFRGNPKKSSVRYNLVPYTGILLTAQSPITFFRDGNYTSDFSWETANDTNNLATYLPTVQVTARWGYSDETPAVIKEAAIMQSIRWYKREQSGMSDTLTSSTMGDERYVKQLDPDVKLILDYSGLRKARL